MDQEIDRNRLIFKKDQEKKEQKKLFFLKTGNAVKAARAERRVRLHAKPKEEGKKQTLTERTIASDHSRYFLKLPFFLNTNGKIIK